MKTTHTPGPLTVKSPLPARYPAYRIVDSTGAVVATVPINAQGGASELAAFIVRACNSHAELLAALQFAMKHVENVFALAGRHDPERAQLEQARAAIAKATEAA